MTTLKNLYEECPINFAELYQRLSKSEVDILKTLYHIDDWDLQNSKEVLLVLKDQGISLNNLKTCFQSRLMNREDLVDLLVINKNTAEVKHGLPTLVDLYQKHQKRFAELQNRLGKNDRNTLMDLYNIKTSQDLLLTLKAKNVKLDDLAKHFQGKLLNRPDLVSLCKMT